jgi:hypothetical protein
MTSISQPVTLPQGFSIGTCQDRWLDPKKPVTLTSRGVYADAREAFEAAGKQAEAADRTMLIGEVHRGNAIAYENFETSITVEQGRHANFVLRGTAFEIAPETVLVARDFALGERQGLCPMRAGEWGAWRLFELSVGNMRERAPLFKPSFKGSSADHARTALAYLGRALPDTMVVGIVPVVSFLRAITSWSRRSAARSVWRSMRSRSCPL